MRRKILLTTLVFVLSLASVASEKRMAASKPAAFAPPITIPFNLVNRHVVMQIKVNNSRPLSFVLDTGDKFAIIDIARARELGLKLKGEVRMGGGGAGQAAGSFVQDATFTVPGLAGFSQPVQLALPTQRLASRMGQDFDGILGSEFIKEFVVELDYQASVLRLHDKTQFDYSGPGESIPIKINSAGHPIIDAEVTPIGSDPVKGKFVLDIGSGGALILYSPFVNEHHLLKDNSGTIKAIGGAGAGGAVTGRIGRVSELKIGAFKLANPTTMFSEDQEGALASSALIGNIGARVLSRFRLFLDYDHERIIFEANKTFAESFDRASPGMAIVAEGNDYRTFRITELLDSGPAVEAGLQKNDVITGIDGKPAAEFTLSKVFDLFERPAAYKLQVRRGEQILHVTLTPRKLV